MKRLEEIKNNFLGKYGERENIIKTTDIKNVSFYKTGFYNLILSKEPNFIQTPEVKKVLNDLFFYSVGDVAYCFENNISLNKSIYLVGTVGTGKSLLMDVLQDFTLLLHSNTFNTAYMGQIRDNVEIDGIKALDKFTLSMDYKAFTYYIDDFADTLSEVNNYGTKINVIESLISKRYMVYSKARKLTHFSSNKYPAELKEILDLRTIDRLKEMCNLIEIKGESFRK